MELETQQTVGQLKKEKVKVSTILLAIGMMGISVAIAVCICMPNVWQQILLVKGELIKGTVIGLTALPVFLFVTIKGGKHWFKKWWVWATIALTMIALIAIVTLSGGGSSTPGMGPEIMPNPEMNMEGPVDGGGNVMVKPMG